MDPITIVLRSSKTPAASAPVGGEMSAAEIDANFDNLKTAAEQLDAEKLAASDAVALAWPADAKASPVDGDYWPIWDTEAVPPRFKLVSKAAILSAVNIALAGKQAALISGTNIKTINGQALPGAGDIAIAGGTSTPLGLWDYWYSVRMGTTGATAPDMFVGAAISSGTNNTAIPTGGQSGFNSYGVLLRSGTTANGGYRYSTTSISSDYFGTISHKGRFQFLWRTAFAGRTVRGGFLDTTTSADAADGAYFEIVGDVCSAKTANNSTRTTDATTITLALDTAYTFDIDVNAAGTEARFRVYGGNTYQPALMDVTITTNIPSTSARAFGFGVVATESSTTASDIGILYSLGCGTVEGFDRAVGSYVPVLYAPEAFTAGQWTATAGDTQIVVDITALPADGGSTITALEYTLNGSTWTAFAGTGTGPRTITGLTNDTAYPLQIRAVNAVGAGAASDTKSRTPVVASAGPAISDSSRAGPSSFGTTLAITPPAGMVAGDHLVVVVYGSSAFSSMSAGTWFDRTPAAWSTSGRRLLVSDTFGSVPGTLTATFGGSSLHEASVFSISNIATGAVLGSGEGTTGSAAGARDHNYTTTAANSVAIGFIDFIGGAVTGVGTPDAAHEWDLNPAGGYLNGFAGLRATSGSYAASLAPVGDSSPSEYGWAEIGSA